MKDKPQTLTPKLRFPEFKEGPGWGDTALGDLLTLEYGESLPEYSRRPGSVPVVGSNGIVGRHDEALIKGPTIVVGRKGSVGQVNWINADCFPIDTTFYVKNKDASNNSLHFLYRLLSMSRLEDRKDPGAVPGLNRNEVHSIRTAVPSPVEQRKIAACLTSLDEWIAAEGRKLEVLRTHKKGLMQQLFPREGQTRPCLRFPEFRDAPEWNGRRIGDLLEKASFPVEVDAEKRYREIGVRSHGKGIFHKDKVKGSTIGTKRVFRVVEDAFVLNIVFAWEQAVAFTTKTEAGMIASHRFPMFLPKENACDVRFLKLAFLTPTGKHVLGLASPGGAGRNRTLGQDEFDKVAIVVPGKDEQARIADVVLAADALIDAQSRKLDSLGAHKKGLIQQLFPPPEDAKA